MHKMHEVFFGYLFLKEQQCQRICTGPSMILLHICYVPPQQMLQFTCEELLSSSPDSRRQQYRIASHHGVERMTRIL